jgi:hypothetical protein
MGDGEGYKFTQESSVGVAEVAAIAAQWQAEGRYDTPPEPKQSVVYFVRAGKMRAVKIGRTTDFPKRVSFLQIGNHQPIECVLLIRGGGEELELELHDRFRHLRIRGEWFIYGPEIRAFIRNTLKPARRRKSAKLVDYVKGET